MTDQIKKRNGSIVSFDRARIERAMDKAFIATGVPLTETQLFDLTNLVVREIDRKFVERVPGVEDIQDIVERVLAESGHFNVSKSYVLYRREREKVRERKKWETLERVERRELNVKRRDGTTARFDVAQIERAIRNVSNEYPAAAINVYEILEDVKTGLYDGISTSEINQVVLMALKARIERDPVYSNVAARFLANDLYKEVLGVDEFEKGFIEAYQSGFAKAMKRGVECGRFDKRVLEADLEALGKTLVPERDQLFEFMGIQTLYDRYFMRDYDQNIFEVPQYFWMRVALGLSLIEPKKEARAMEFYHTISTFRYVPSTPTLLHSATTHPQMSSCYLTTVEDDLHHIFKCIGDNAQLSKWSGGVGNDWSNLRAVGALIKSINTTSQGVVPFLKIVDATTASINRSGKRRGATCVYLETWHYEVEDFLELRKNTGDERRRTHDINTSNWIPDLFMKRLREDGEWTLFSPDEVGDLHHVYGKEFEKRYIEYEAKADKGEIQLWKRIKAQELWRKMITMLFETGHPWMTFKDPCNIRSPQDHVGVVHSSNLCTEITLNTSREETAVCNLGSVNLVRHFEHGKINYELLGQTVITAIRLLDNVIDLNYYPTIEAKNSNLQHRPVGLGIMGYQDLLYKVRMQFASEEAVQLSDSLMEFVSYHAILASSKLAEERGTYSSYKGSKWDRGLFPVDTLGILEEERGIPTGIEKEGKLDWAPVRESVKKHGMRNSNCLAIAPTATIANISGCLPSIEPIYKNLYVKSNFSGEFTVINKYLVEDLERLNLWKDEIVEKLKFYDGSVQRIAELPEELRNRYMEVFEIDPHWIVEHAAHRGKWIDQSQSVNIFTASESGPFIADVYMEAWQKGLKTTYYLRTLGASSIEKSTLDINKKYDTPPATESIPEVMAVAAVASTLPSSAGEPQPQPSTSTSFQRDTQVELASASTLRAEITSPSEVKDPSIVSASKVIHIAEGGLCEACQ
ncbi:MAG: ribonucleoside-diphosphate reductase subunit alpha [Candidatus Liptonbacteria bacterium]|nr:ribonucleoside-diphosphate reductase subunit alpha [Candidatus Liptonbacteria bacterium]